jgi:putative inorganic carbon (hco3(-)) transporter
MHANLPPSSNASRSYSHLELRRTAQSLLSLEIIAVGGLAAASMAVERLLPFAAFVPAFFWIVRLAVEGRLTRRTYSDLGILLAALMLPVTLWVSAIPEKTIPQVYRLLSGILLYYAVVNGVKSRSSLRLLVAGLAGVTLLLAVAAPLGVEWQSGKIPLIPRGLYEGLAPRFADTINPNVMAASIGLFLPIPAGLLLFSWMGMSWGERALSSLAFLAGSAALVLTQSRSGIFAFAAALALLALLRGRWGWMLLVVGAASAGLGLTRFGLGNALNLIFNDQALQGLDGRIEIWSRAVYMLQDFPFTGIGMGLFREVADTLYPFFLFPPDRIPHAHNLFLQVGVDLGLPGLIGWLAALFGVVWAAGRTYMAGVRGRDSWLRGLGAGLLASLVVLVLHGWMDAAIWGMVKPAPLMWLVWGTAAASGLHARTLDLAQRQPVQEQQAV